MSSRQKVLDALGHRSGKGVPIDFGGTSVSGMHVSCVAALRDFFGLEKRLVKVHEPGQMLGWIDEDLKQIMGIDVEGVFPRMNKFGFPAGNWKSWRTYSGLEVLVPEQFNTTIDEKGDTLMHPEGDVTAPPSARMPRDGFFFDAIIRQSPIQEETLNPEDNLEEYRIISEEDLAYLKELMSRAECSGRAVCASFGGMALGDIALIPGTSLRNPKGIRDITEWYISTRTRRDYVHRVFSRQCEIALENLRRIHLEVGEAVNVVFICGTDFGTQSSSFCSVETFRELYMPYYRQLNQWIHQNTQWRTFKHSCGAIEKFIDSLIESGFDILNPVQCSATGMEPERLKDKYGSRLVFWGGGVDTQRVLPFGTPQTVRQQVLQRCEAFSRGGGFVFNSIHNIQAETPVENIVAMLRAVNEFNGKSFPAA